jgi:hypothetical protein
VVGTAATAAVFAGTAGAVQHRQQRRWAKQEQQAAHDAQMAQQPAAYDEPEPEYYDEPPEAAPESDLVAELQKLAELHQAGALDDAEFAAAKQKLING